MGDQQVICEVPAENITGDCCNSTNHECCQQTTESNFRAQIPCAAPMSFDPCTAEHRTPCNMECCYQQPPRPPMYKPESNYVRPTAPMECETIYKRSYIGSNGDFRAKPVKVFDSIKPYVGPMDPNTVQKLSYQPHSGFERTLPIQPKSNGLRFEGPAYDITSQKHDFVPKCYSKRTAIKITDGIGKCCAPLERCTVNKLSYMPYNICNNPPPKPILPVGQFPRSDAPIEHCTIQKLSYQPVPLPSKEDMPWAKKIRVEPPLSGPLCTTYKLSFIPNCNPQKTPIIPPVSTIRIIGSAPLENSTVYKLSYLQSCGIKPTPIMPKSGIHPPTGPMEKCTVYKLSYLPQGCPTRTAPIRPKGNVYKSYEPMQRITTQKHDYVPKPCNRRDLIIPPTSMSTPSCPMEKCTINKLSYLPVCNPTKNPPILPKPGLCRIDAPISKCTTYKLSYMPVPIPPKESLPWATLSSYARPTAPIEQCTIQKLSYRPPGVFMRKGNCGCCCDKNMNPSSNFPKAAVCG